MHPGAFDVVSRARFSTARYASGVDMDAFSFDFVFCFQYARKEKTINGHASEAVAPVSSANSSRLLDWSSRQRRSC